MKSTRLDLMIIFLILPPCQAIAVSAEDFLSQVQSLPALTKDADIIIYGGTSGGITAAVQASKMGKSVILIEPTRHLGGLSSGGLGATDIGNKAAIGGLSREFYQRIYRYYTNKSAWNYQDYDAFRSSKRGKSIVNSNTGTMWHFEPHVAEKIFRDMLDEQKTNVTIVFGERLDLNGGVVKDGPKITSIKMESGKIFSGRMFIDASYEGDLMAKAGVRYHVGREANMIYNETLNGVQTKLAKFHQFTKPIDPYVKPGNPKSGLLPGVQDGGPGPEGSGDRRVQAYNFRVCLTKCAKNRIPFPKPAKYNEKRYELLLRYFEAGGRSFIGPANPMPNHKTDTNNKGAFSTDNIGMNYDYPDGDYATRRKIIADHRDYQMGFLWTAANHPRMPNNIRNEFSKWGLARDEFTDNGNWPHQLYVREARRMISDYVMIEHNCRGKRVAENSVGLAAYTMDSHNTQRYVDADGHVRNEGDVQVGGFPPYPIDYRSIVPKAAECTNLLVPVCLSASHIAYGSIRMEPVFMVLGQSAATAAVQAIEQKCDTQAIDFSRLQKRLLDDKQILVWADKKKLQTKM